MRLLFREFSISELLASSCIRERVFMQSIKPIVILYKPELYFREATNSQILAKIKFSRKFLDLQ